jgi:hypothetical protein
MKRILVPIVILCILFNSSIAMGSIAPSSSLPAPAVESPIFQIISSVRLPFCTASDLFTQTVPLFPEFRQHAANRKSNNGADGIFISSSAKETRLTGRNNRNSEIKAAKDFRSLILASGLLRAQSPPLRWRSDRNETATMILLTYLVVLSRSHLPGRIALSDLFMPQLRNSNGAFLLSDICSKTVES